MRTALDTNAISSIWSSEESAPGLLNRLDEAVRWGSLVICPVVYAELHGYPHMTAEKIEEFLRFSRIEVDWQTEREIWELAGDRFSGYAKRRRKAKQAEPRRLLADFIIGAHAQLRADQLLTLDQRRFRHDFPELVLL